MVKARDDFPKHVKQVLAERAAYLCSNPECRGFTIFAHTEEDKSAKIGVAAHICAAAEGGPRYDPDQTPEQRSSPSNGIWLCASCATKIDRDIQRFPVSLLIDWKTSHEKWIRGEQFLPPEPTISWFTHAGRMHMAPDEQVIDATKLAKRKEHKIAIWNSSNKSISDIRLRFTLPEQIIAEPQVDAPSSTVVKMTPPTRKKTRSSKAGVAITDYPRWPSPEMTIDISRIPTNRSIDINLVTEQCSTQMWMYMMSSGPPPAGKFSVNELISKLPDKLVYMLIGEYQCEVREESILRPILSVLVYSRSMRSISVSKSYVGRGMPPPRGLNMEVTSIVEGKATFKSDEPIGDLFAPPSLSVD